MKQMSHKEIDRWAKVRAKGKRRFVALDTFVYWLIPIASTFIWRSIKSLWTGHLEFSSIDYGERLFVSAIFAMWGYFQSKHQWRLREESYKASVEAIKVN